MRFRKPITSSAPPCTRHAARVASHAVGGEVLVSSLVRELIADGASTVSFLEGREVELKGLEGQHRLYALAPAT